VARRFRCRRSFVAPPIITTSQLVSAPAGGQPAAAPDTLLDPAARMHLLLAAVDNARSARQEIEAHYASEMLHIVVGLAHKTQTKPLAHDFIAWQKQVQEMMAKHEEAIGALEFGIEQFNSQIKLLLDRHPDEMSLALKEELARLGESQVGLEANEGTVQRKITALRQLLARLERKRKATSAQPGNRESAPDGKR
jgi:phage shock protein A